MRKTRKQLKQTIKLYQSDNGALADEAIKYKELAERATVDCIRLVTHLKKYRERANFAETFIERLLEANSDINAAGVGDDEWLRWQTEWKSLVAEWQNRGAR